MFNNTYVIPTTIHLTILKQQCTHIVPTTTT
jgi:hypothetical protein